MKKIHGGLGFTLFGLLLFSNAIATGGKWRALIVYTNAVDAANFNANMYQTKFLGLFDELNDLYEDSDIDTRAEIAGVIWDKAFVGSNSVDDLIAMTNRTGGMARYVSLLEKYGADVLILRDKTLTLDDGRANFLDRNAVYPGHGTVYKGETIGYGAMWVSSDVVVVWAHEAGHVHGASHCDGYRQVYNADGTFAPNSPYVAGVSGFNTIMAYPTGNSDECAGVYDDGNANVTTTQTFLFSSPNLYWDHYHPYLHTTVTYNLGPSGHNVVGIHNANDEDIRDFYATPVDLLITDDMSLEQWDYADFLATGSVTIEPGFHFDPGAKMNISIGSMALSKRGFREDQHFLSEESFPLKTGNISDFTLKYLKGSEGLAVSFKAEKGISVSINIYDISGTHLETLGNFEVMDEGFSKEFSLTSKAKGTYVVKVVVGKENIYQKIVKN